MIWDYGVWIVGQLRIGEDLLVRDMFYIYHPISAKA